MELPAHFLPRPPMDLDAATRSAFEQLYASSVEGGSGASIQYQLAAPKWQLLCWLADMKPTVLSADTFEQQSIDEYRGFKIESTQVASLAPVRPLAKLSIMPEDFPFLRQIRRHDPAVLRQRAQADPGGFPWLDDD